MRVRMPRKGQAEFALILGLVIIAAVVGLFAMQTISPPSIAPSAMSSEQREATSFALDVVEGAVIQSVSDIYHNGGYADDSTSPLGSFDTKKLGGGEVPYWQMCGSYNVPDVESELTEQIKSNINAFVPERSVMAGKAITFNKFNKNVDVTIYDSRITVSVNIPTVFDGVTLPAPYVIDVPSNLGRINDFASNFARMQSDCRVLDSHLISALSKSSEYSDCFVPFSPGNAERSYTLTWNNLKDCTKRYIDFSLANTIIGFEIPTDDEGRIRNLRYEGFAGHANELFFVPGVIDYSAAGDGVSVCSGDGITGSAVGIDKYRDLTGKMFLFGDDDGLDETEFKAPNMVEIRPETGTFTNFLQGLTVATYGPYFFSVKYPVIGSVWDEKFGEPFRFGLYVYMDESNIGQCQAPPVLSELEQSNYAENYGDICVAANEEVLINVLDDDGKPVNGAEVYFFGCLVGVTQNGLLPGVVPQAIAPLVIMKGNKVYSEMHSYEDLELITVRMPEIKNYPVEFFGVNIEKTGTEYRFSQGTKLIRTDKMIEIEMLKELDPLEYIINPYYIWNIDELTGKTVYDRYVTNLPVIKHNASIFVTDMIEGEVVGFAMTENFEPSGNKIYVYAPVVSGLTSDFSEADEIGIKNLYSTCNGLEAIMSQPWGGTCL